jgi:hypothetical protein
MKTVPACAVVLFVALRATSAFADDTAVCLDAVAKGQALRDGHKLIEAREQFRLCAVPACPAVLQHDCTSWIEDADKAIPTVVLSAKDASGNDVFDVTVTLDGAPLASKLDGAALRVNPGAHTFRFQWRDGASTERQVLVTEGRKDLVVAASFAQAVSLPSAPPAPVAGTQAPAAAAPGAGAGGMRIAGFVVGGLGLASIVVGSVLGGLTFAEVSTAKNACGSEGCAHNTSQAAVSDMQSARGLGNASTGTFIAGGALVAAGAVMVLIGGPKPQGSALLLAPTLTAHGGAIGLQGAW